jgi:hypothetical protein
MSEAVAFCNSALPDFDIQLIGQVVTLLVNSTTAILCGHQYSALFAVPLYQNSLAYRQHSFSFSDSFHFEGRFC